MDAVRETEEERPEAVPQISETSKRLAERQGDFFTRMKLAEQRKKAKLENLRRLQDAKEDTEYGQQGGKRGVDVFACGCGCGCG